MLVTDLEKLNANLVRQGISFINPLHNCWVLQPSPGQCGWNAAARSTQLRNGSFRGSAQPRTPDSTANCQKHGTLDFLWN